MIKKPTHPQKFCVGLVVIIPLRLNLRYHPVHLLNFLIRNNQIIHPANFRAIPFHHITNRIISNVFIIQQLSSYLLLDQWAKLFYPFYHSQFALHCYTWKMHMYHHQAQGLKQQSGLSLTIDALVFSFI